MINFDNEYVEWSCLPRLSYLFAVWEVHGIFTVTLTRWISESPCIKRKLSISRKKDGQTQPREWLVYSFEKKSFYCLPCRLFSTDAGKAVLASQGGWDLKRRWHKLYNRVPEHEVSSPHLMCCTNWKMLQLRWVLLVLNWFLELEHNCSRCQLVDVKL